MPSVEKLDEDSEAGVGGGKLSPEKQARQPDGTPSQPATNQSPPKMTRKEFKAFIAMLDQGVKYRPAGMDWNTFFHQIAQKGEVKTNLTEERYLKQYKQIYNDIYCAYMALKIGKSRFDYASFMKNNAIVVKMIDKVS